MAISATPSVASQHQLAAHIGCMEKVSNNTTFTLTGMDHVSPLHLTHDRYTRLSLSPPYSREDSIHMHQVSPLHSTFSNAFISLLGDHVGEPTKSIVKDVFFSAAADDDPICLELPHFDSGHDAHIEPPKEEQSSLESDNLHLFASPEISEPLLDWSKISLAESQDMEKATLGPPEEIPTKKRPRVDCSPLEAFVTALASPSFTDTGSDDDVFPDDGDRELFLGPEVLTPPTSPPQLKRRRLGTPEKREKARPVIVSCQLRDASPVLLSSSSSSSRVLRRSQRHASASENLINPSLLLQIRDRGFARETARPTMYEMYTQANVPWCRYCGTTEGVNWRPGPWGKRTLCNKHGCDYKGYGFASKTPRLDLGAFKGEGIDDRERPVVQLSCSLCSNDTSLIDNRVVYCEGCPKSYHEACWKAEHGFDIPDEQWFCGTHCRHNFEKAAKHSHQR